MSEQERTTPTEKAPASAAGSSGAPSGQSRPPQQGAQSRPPQQGGQSRPPQQGGQSRPPQQGGQSRPPQQGGQSRPPQQGGQGRPPQRGGQGRPPQRGGRGRPPQRGGRRYFRRPRRKVCAFCLDKKKPIDYKDVGMLRRSLTDRGKIRSRRKTGTCAKHQRRLAIAVKRARQVALVPITAEHIRRY